MLCNNAGVNFANGPVAEIPPERFATVFAVNTTGLYACCYAVLPHMIAQGYGRIVNVSSASAFMCQTGKRRLRRLEGRGQRPDGRAGERGAGA